MPNIQRPNSEHDSSERSEASASQVQSQYGDEEDWAQSEIEDLEEEEEASAEAMSEQESAKEQSEGFDYICPPTVKWLLYPDDDDEDD